MSSRALLALVLFLAPALFGGCGSSNDAELLAPAIEAYQGGEHRKALDLLKKLEADGHDSEALQLHMGLVLDKVGEGEQARERFEKAARSYPDSGRALFFLGESLRQAGRLEEALDRLERARKLLPKDPAVWNAMGLVHAARRSWTDAIHCYDGALQLDPRSYAVYYNLGEAYRKADQLANAREALEKAYKLAPPDTAPILFSLGETLFYLSRFTEARRHYARLMAAAPRFAQMGRVYFQLGRIYYQEKRSKEALDLIRLAGKRKYEEGAVALWRGKCLLKLGESQKAHEAFLEARAHPPAPPELDYYLGISAIRLRRYREAYAQFRSCQIAKLPSAEVEAQMGVVRLKQFQSGELPAGLSRKEALGEATRHFRKALAADPTNLVALFGEAQVAFESKDYNGCLNLVDRLLAAATDFPQGLLLSALAFHELGQDEKAILPLERYRVGSPDNARVTFFLAELLGKMSDREPRAVELFQIGLRLDPSDHYARLIYSRLLARQGRFTAAVTELSKVIEGNADLPLRNEAMRLYNLLTETLRSSFAPPAKEGASPLSMAEARARVAGARTVADRCKIDKDRSTLHGAIQELVTLFQGVRTHPRLDPEVRSYLRQEIRRLVDLLRHLH